MRYFGSKGTSIDQIYAQISPMATCGTMCDPFGGIGVVGSFFKSKGYSVTTGDILNFPHCFQIAKIKLNSTPDFNTLLNEYGISSFASLAAIVENDISCNECWFVEDFSLQRQFFVIENARIIQSWINSINGWYRLQLIDEIERSFLIASLINSMDNVANTAGTYYAHLKNYSRKAVKPFQFNLLAPIFSNKESECYRVDATTLLARKAYDIVYLDPPYNERNYAGYYHLPETIANGEVPISRGKSGIPSAQRPCSSFNRRETAAQALELMVAVVDCKVLAFHYADNGLLKDNYIMDVLSQKGTVSRHKINSKGYTTRNGLRSVSTTLYMVLNA